MRAGSERPIVSCFWESVSESVSVSESSESERILGERAYQANLWPKPALLV